MRMIMQASVTACCLLLLSQPTHGQGAPAGASYEQLKTQLESNSSAKKRQAAAVWLGQMGGMHAVPVLIKAMERDQDADVRTAAARALGVLRAKSATNSLRRAAERDPIRSVRDAAHAALRAVGDLHALAGDDAAGKKRYAEDLNKNPGYLTARKHRMAGILVSTIGGGLGLIVGVLGLASWVDCRDHPYRYAGGCDGSVATAIVGSSLLAVSTAVGVPLWVSGRRRIKEMEQRNTAALIPQVSVALGRQRSGFSFRWQF